jgi:hypothetical protein
VDEWEQLLTLVFANRKKIKDGEYHACLVHFGDNNKQLKGQGGKKAGMDGNKVCIDIAPSRLYIDWES